jgi:multiple sugar transport system substrate-binding protein
MHFVSSLRSRRGLATRMLGSSVLLGVVSCLAVGGTGAGGAGTSRPVTLTVAYWSGYNPPGTNIMPAWLHAAQVDLNKVYPNVKVVGDEITTNSESDYYAKLDLTERSASTAPDVAFEDSFLIGSDASAGFLRAIPQVKAWSGWSHFYAPMRSVVMYHGRPYGIMNSTDVQLIYYSRALFKKAGLPASWQPHSWADVLAAARAIKQHDPGVTPLWVYTGQPVGEASSFRGFEVFLNGTHDQLYDPATGKWLISGPGLTATFKLLAAMRPYEESEADWSNPGADATVALSLIPHQQVGIVFDGSWVATAYVPGGLQPWPGFFTAYGEAKIPTQTGQSPGYTNQSGGWALSVPQLARHPALSLAFIEAASSAPRLASFDPSSGNLPPRDDVLSQPAWVRSVKVNPVSGFAAAQVPYTTYRPNLPAYVQVSNVIQQLTGEISSGSITAGQAASDYASAVTQIVGAANTERASR